MIQEARGVREGEGPMVPEELQERLEVLRDNLAEADARVREVVREYPVASFLGALALGFIVGRIASR